MMLVGEFGSRCLGDQYIEQCPCFGSTQALYGSESKPRLLDKVVSAARLYVMNSLFRGTQRRIYVPNSAIPESSCVWIVLFAISVGMYLS
jgi:hypothetical protein